MKVQDFTSTKLSKLSEKSKWSQDFFVHMVWLYLSLPSRYNFSTFHRYGNKSESTYRRHFSESHDMDKFNLNLLDEHGSNDIFWAYDPCYITKSGYKTYGLDTFWSGSANCSKKGLEIGSIAAVDVKQHTAFHYKAVQTPSHKERTASLLEYYSNVLIAQKSVLQTRSCVVVADAYFSKFTFVHPLCEAGFEVISRFRNDVYLRYLYRGPQKGHKGKNIGKGKGSGGGRPKTYDGKVDLLNLNPQYFTLCYHDEEKGETGYEAIVNAKALKRNVRVMVIHKEHKKGEPTAQVYFSTNIHRLATNLYVNYKLRFQQEFLFRDTKQFLGLQTCGLIQILFTKKFQ